MKSAILKKDGFGFMEEIYHAIDIVQLGYNWLITNCECYPIDQNIAELFSKEYIWVSGNELTEMISNKYIPFYWGVFSGFQKETSLEEVLKYNLPFADGYPGFWVDHVGIQHPLADIEIVVWDRTSILFISKLDDLVQQFRDRFPLSEDLSAQNKRHNSEIAHIQDLLVEELMKRNIDITENTLYHKYSIWRKLYLNKNHLVRDEDILQCINESLDSNSG